MHTRLHSVLRCPLLLAPAALVLALVVLPTPHAQADAPPCRYTTSADTVLDRDTGLTWQRSLDASSYTWAEAATYCNNLQLAGQSDWRLPSIQELQTIVDESNVDPAIDTTAFPNTLSSVFWSSSPHADDSSSAWYVTFGYGEVHYDFVGAADRVRCVR